MNMNEREILMTWAGIFIGFRLSTSRLVLAVGLGQGVLLNHYGLAAAVLGYFLLFIRSGVLSL